ncbi:hypothetical protein [Parasedimentitalea psychrophila]|nr:hypothetical protein [Parasedimentitalea psychrophila]
MDEARKLAKEVMGQVAKGENPAEDTRNRGREVDPSRERRVPSISRFVQQSRFHRNNVTTRPSCRMLHCAARS